MQINNQRNEQKILNMGKESGETTSDRVKIPMNTHRFLQVT